MKPGISSKSREEELRIILKTNLFLEELLNVAEEANLPNWYVGAGCIAGTVWNYLSGLDPTKNIKDYDLVYFDPQHLSAASERNSGLKILRRLKMEREKVEIVNEARVHLWYEKDFGKKIEPYKSSEDSIKMWPTTATAVAVRKQSGKLIIFAPYSLDDLFEMVARANKIQVFREVYEEKVNRWKKAWPRLKVIPWEEPI